jgi:RHS repeat-associated protein
MCGRFNLSANRQTWPYGYDNKNELIWVEQRATDGGTLEQRVTYSYDALGNRIQRTVDPDGDGDVDETDRFGVDNGNVWVVMDGSNNFGSRRLFGPDVDQVMARVTNGGTVAWYLTDYQNSVTVMVDGSGTVQDRITYDGFGKIVTETAPTFGDGYKYTGREWDASAQLQYNRARYYDPNLGKWISMDPMGFAAGDANLYRYVGNAPTNATDPSGLKHAWNTIANDAVYQTYLNNYIPSELVLLGGALNDVADSYKQLAGDINAWLNGNLQLPNGIYGDIEDLSSDQQTAVTQYSALVWYRILVADYSGNAALVTRARQTWDAMVLHFLTRS